MPGHLRKVINMAVKKDFGSALIRSLGGGPKAEPEMGEDDNQRAPLESAAQDLIDAVNKGDVQGVSDALETAFMFLDSQTHEEGGE
jgi:hypothetical protein